MKEKYYYLSESDRLIFKDLYRDMQEWRATRGSKPPVPEIVDPGSKVFIAKVISAGGIPAASSSTMPGIGEVAIRQLSWSDEAGFDPYTDLTRQITGTDRLPEGETTDYVQPCYNLSTEVDFPFGEYILVFLLASGYLVAMEPPKFAREGIPGSGGACGCFCVTGGDVEVDGIETVSRWTVFLPTIIETQEHGRLILPSNRHILLLNETEASGSDVGLIGNWYKDISSEIEAEYTSGEDATTATAATGYIDFDRSIGGYTTLTVVLDGTVPAEV